MVSHYEKAVVTDPESCPDRVAPSCEPLELPRGGIRFPRDDEYRWGAGRGAFPGSAGAVEHRSCAAGNIRRLLQHLFHGERACAACLGLLLRPCPRAAARRGRFDHPLQGYRADIRNLRHAPMHSTSFDHMWRSCRTSAISDLA